MDWQKIAELAGLGTAFALALWAKLAPSVAAKAKLDDTQTDAIKVQTERIERLEARLEQCVRRDEWRTLVEITENGLARIERLAARRK